MGRTPLGSGRVFQYSSDRETRAGHAPSVLVAGRRSATTGSSLSEPDRGSEPSCIRERRIALRTSLQRSLRQASERCLKARAGNPRLRFSAPLNLDRSCRPAGSPRSWITAIRGIAYWRRRPGSRTVFWSRRMRSFNGLGLDLNFVVNHTVANGCRPPQASRPAEVRRFSLAATSARRRPAACVLVIAFRPPP